MPKISIIIPVYNGEKYLRACLDSAVNQTLKDIEIICLNNGSTDGTAEILKEYEKRYNNVIVITREKSYAGVSRNHGLEIATGEYIMFLDSDDWLELDACEQLYNQITQNHNDFVYFNLCDYINEKHKKVDVNYKLKPFNKFFDEKNIKLYELTTPFISGAECWYKIYKKSFLDKYNIRFSSERFCEDVPFYVKAIVNAESVSILNKPFYIYRKYLQSSTTTCAAEHWKDLFTTREKAYRIILASNHQKEFLRIFLPYYINSTLYWFDRWSKDNPQIKKSFYNKMHSLFKYLDSKHDLKEIKQYINYARVEEIIKHSWEEYHLLKIARSIFSCGNSKNHKVITLCGIKMKFKLNRVPLCVEYKQLCKKYEATINRLKKEAKTRKIRVAFYVNDTRWKCQNLFDLMEKSGHYEPFIIVGRHATGPFHFEYQTKEQLEEIYNTYVDLNMKVFMSYDFDTGKFIPLSTFKPDIIFYSRQWGLHKNHNINATADYALSCYVPYFISNSPATFEAGSEFHNKLWKYYVINNDLVNEYKKVMPNKGKNLKVAGYPNLEEYLINDKPEKKYTIYAPHWSLGKTTLNYATFDWNGKYILDYAKSHPEMNWVFKPHPILKGELVESGLMTEQEAEDYYNEWDKFGIKYEGFDYIKLFKQSKVLITDCGSFLAEYMPSKNPVILLRSNRATPYNFLAKKVTKYYYKAHNLKELDKLFEEVLIKGKDPYKEKRLQMLKNLHLVNHASQNILEDLNKELGLK